MDSTSISADLVRSAVASTATCSVSTASTLRDLLIPRATTLDTTETARKAATRSVAVAKSRTTKSSKATTTKTRVTIKELSITDERLSAKERSILATEIINGALKALSAAISSPAPAVRKHESKDLVKASAQRTLRRSISLQSPLQQRSLNRVTSSPSPSTRSSRSSSSASTATGQRAVAECAHIAFACLRGLQASKTAPLSLPELQLESGMSALIGKLITLGLDDLALRELRLLKKRLDSYGQQSKPALKTAPVATTRKLPTATKSAVPNAEPLTLSDLLEFGDCIWGARTLSLVVTTQLQVLKLIVTSKKPSHMKAALPKLMPPCPSSPITYILHQASEPGQATKASRQLETLSQLLFALCPSISNSEDLVALEPRIHAAPDVALQLQALAFETRLQWWKLCDHPGDAGKDIFEPFSRCVGAFARRSNMKRQDSFQTALAAYERVVARAEPLMQTNQESSKSALIRIYKTLGSLAQDAGLYNEAISWTERVRSNLGDANIAGIQTCCVAAKLAALKLTVDPSDPTIEGLLVQVLQELEGPLKGESSVIDELLTEVSAARRATITLLSMKDGQSPQKPALCDGLRQICESLIYMCPKFCLRYLGRAPEPSATTKQILRFEKRRLFVSKFAYQTVDAALYLLKSLLGTETMTWELLDSVLQDCLALLDQIDTLQLKAKENSSQSHFVKISHIYYARFLKPRLSSEQGKNRDSREIRALRRSIDCVRRRSSDEKNAASYSAKLERLSDSYRGMGRYDDAFSTLTTLRDEAISSGALTRTVAQFDAHPSQAAWNSSDEASSLARTIGNIVKVQIRRGMGSMETILPLPPALSDEEHGAILECGLDTLLSILCQNKSPRTQQACVSVTSRLLDLYSSSRYPIRRLRVIARICLCDSELYAQTPAHLQDIGVLLQRIDEEQVQDSKDLHLQPYLAHLRGMLRSIYELQRLESNIDTIRDIVTTWSRLIDCCKDEASLTNSVDSVVDFLGHLRSLADFLDMKGYGIFRVVVLRLIISINELLTTDTAVNEVIRVSCQLSSQYLELGYSGKAGLTLDKVNSLINRAGAKPQTTLRYRLSYAEYYLTIGNVEKCEEFLSLSDTPELLKTQEVGVGRRASMLMEKNLQNRLVSEAYSICSLVALERGSLDTALLHAKASVRLLWRCWTNTEQEARRWHQSDTEGRPEKLADEMASLNLSTTISPAASTQPQTLSGSCFWPLVYPLYRSLSQLSSIFAHHGLYQETMYYAEQARKMVVLANSEVYAAIATAQVGQVFLKGGVKSSAVQYLSEAQELCRKFEKNRYSAWTQCLLGGLHRLQLNSEEASAAYNHAVTTIDSLMLPTYIGSIDRGFDEGRGLESQLAQLSLAPQPPARKQRTTRATRSTRTTTTRSRAPAKTSALVKTAVDPSESVASECPELSSFKGHVLRQKAHAMVLCRRFLEATELLEQANLSASSQQDAVEQHIGMARRLLEHSFEQMTSDPVYSMLQDSTISFPAISSSMKGEKLSGDRMAVVRTPPQRTITDRARSKTLASAAFTDMLQQAHEHLLAAYGIASHISSTAVCNTLSVLLNSTVILLSAAGQSKGKSLAHLGIASCSVDMARILAYKREQKIVRLDSNDADDLNWPSPPPEVSGTRNTFSADLARFQKEYIDIIPTSWMTISISLSESHDELCITKYQAGHNPFVLRLPLGRHNSRDADEEVFGFDEGRAEMRSISLLADESAHSGADLKGKASKKAWWTQRLSLDLRLKDLLENIERVWLGGFKGIFSQHERRSDLLAKFQRSFQNILDKHLPSRQKTGRKAKTPHVSLDSRILELFIGLGDASSEDCDIEEELTDLLYFVIDVLQFHGERNAYDEIDFDSIAVETLDILRSYHAAIKASKSSNNTKHTILILDKALHCFPWESLPCMDGLAVSRLPSLECLRENIMSQKATAAQIPGQYLERDSGVYILNPDGDLKSTQETFEADLQTLLGWDSIVERAPTESEFQAQLSTKDLVLYFGHGSGAQYIRSKSIKKLDKCAVTMLMGCSSGVLTYTNEFQLYGPVMDYMHAGSPAVVATLWDITDRDVDRFAKRTFEEWGLFGEGGHNEGDVSSRGSAYQGQQTSLVEAVAKGREACMLRYLTAAAVVVYGVPVYFK